MGREATRRWVPRRRRRQAATPKHRSTHPARSAGVNLDYYTVSRELHDLSRIVGAVAGAVGSGSDGGAASRQIERLIDAVRRLVAAHSPDTDGWCSRCGRRGDCPVRDELLPYYAAGWWVASAGPLGGIGGGSR